MLFAEVFHFSNFKIGGHHRLLYTFRDLFKVRVHEGNWITWSFVEELFDESDNKSAVFFFSNRWG